MSRINTNVSSLIAQRVLKSNNNALSTSLERLSTGFKINRGADDPAGLIASENLRAEKRGISTAINNATRAANIVGTAEGGLNEVSALLTELQGLVGQSASSGGLSAEETAANQLQANSILETINRIAQSTSFQGKKLLNGTLAYTTSSVGTSALIGLAVNTAKVPDGATQKVVVNVVTASTTAQLGYVSGAISGTVNLEVTGNLGTQQLAFTSGTKASAIVAAINGVKAATGVSATLVLSTSFNVNSTGYGANAMVGLKALSGSFALAANTDNGANGTVTVNGASAQVDGLAISYSSGNLDLAFDLDATANVAAKVKTFGITGGGATFALGSKVSEADKASLGISSVSTGSLGDTTLGFLSSLGADGVNNLASVNLGKSQQILDKAIKQVSQLRGRLGAFQKFTVGSTVNALGVAFENASAAESAIRDTDFAEETSQLTRAQILSQAASTVLAQANAAPQSALALLRG